MEERHGTSQNWYKCQFDEVVGIARFGALVDGDMLAVMSQCSVWGSRDTLRVDGHMLEEVSKSCRSTSR